MDRLKNSFLFDTYKRYKSYTTSFSDWLIDCANALGLMELQPKTKIPIRYYVPIATAISQSDLPAEDVAKAHGMLWDAVRLRKETEEFYRFGARNDEGHSHFTSVLEEVGRILQPKSNKDGRNSHRKNAQQQPPSKDNLLANPYVLLIVGDDEQAAQANPPPCRVNTKSSHRGKKNVEQRSKSSAATTLLRPILSEADLATERDFALLCFFYDFNSIREYVLQVWTEYNEKKLDVATAATVTNVALGIIQRNADAFAEELEEGVTWGPSCKNTLANAITNLYSSISSGAKLSLQELQGIEECDPEARRMARMFCMEAIVQLEDARSEKPNTIASAAAACFMHSFSKMNAINLHPPLSDNLTSAMRFSGFLSTHWLPFGLQVIFDIQRRLNHDLVDGFIDFADISKHIFWKMLNQLQYEVDILSSAMEQDYMLKINPKFFEIFKNDLDLVKEWALDDAVKKKSKAVNAPHSEPYCFFLILQPILSGLLLYKFQENYQSKCISHTAWLTTATMHLYNAAKQVGGLDVDWADMDFLIQYHGSDRIFVGSPPTNTADFSYRLKLAWGVSLKSFASDRKSGAIKKKKSYRTERGLRMFSPLLDHIRLYHEAGPDTKWIALQNLLAYLTKAALGTEEQEDEGLKGHDNALRLTFSGLSKDLNVPPSHPPVSKSQLRKQKKHPTKSTSPRSPPTFPPLQESLVQQLTTLKTLLAAEELHLKFDYLSLTRRIHKLISRIRSEVLYPPTSTSLTSLSAKLEPRNFALLEDLFMALRQNPKDLEHITKIAEIMREVLSEEGAVEVEKAERELGRWFEAVEFQKGQRVLSREEMERGMLDARVRRKRRSFEERGRVVGVGKCRRVLLRSREGMRYVRQNGWVVLRYRVDSDGNMHPTFLERGCWEDGSEDEWESGSEVSTDDECWADAVECIRQCET